MDVDPATVGWICIVVVFILLIAGIPVAIALATLGFLGFWAINGLGPALGIVALVPFSTASVYALSVIPFFIFMGNVAFHAGFGSDIFRLAQTWLGRIPGGLAHATVAGCAVFGAICGSGIAGAATMGRIAIPELFKHGYDRALSIGTVAASGTLAQMIPPSVLMVVYALITNQSVGKMLIAGIVPGIITAGSYSLMIAVRIKKNPSLGPALARVNWAERAQAIRGIWPVILLIVIIVGGILYRIVHAHGGRRRCGVRHAASRCHPATDEHPEVLDLGRRNHAGQRHAVFDHGGRQYFWRGAGNVPHPEQPVGQHRRPRPPPVRGSLRHHGDVPHPRNVLRHAGGDVHYFTDHLPTASSS